MTERKSSLWLSCIIDGMETLYRVSIQPSESGMQFILFKYIEGAKTGTNYIVWREGHNWHCNCPDHQQRNRQCKHLKMLHNHHQLR